MSFAEDLPTAGDIEMEDHEVIEKEMAVQEAINDMQEDIDEEVIVEEK